MAASDQERSGVPDGASGRPRTFLRRNKKIIVWVTIYAILLEIAFLTAPEPVSAALTFANKILGVFDWAFIGVQTLAEDMAASRHPARTVLSVHIFMVIWAAIYLIVFRILADILSGRIDGYVEEPGTQYERPQGTTRTLAPPKLLMAYIFVTFPIIVWVLCISIREDDFYRIRTWARPLGFGQSIFGVIFFGAQVLASVKLLEALIVGIFLWRHQRKAAQKSPQ